MAKLVLNVRIAMQLDYSFIQARFRELSFKSTILKGDQSLSSIPIGFSAVQLSSPMPYRSEAVGSKVIQETQQLKKSSYV